MTREETIAILRGMTKNNEDEDAAIFAAIQALSPHELPTKLEEAAEELNSQELLQRIKENRVPMDLVRAIFKAGAKWNSPAYNTIKRVLAIGFMHTLDEIRPENKMCLSNGECMDIERAFDERDWEKLERYLKKYSPNQ